MNVDPGVAIGIAGAVLAAISLGYARTQAQAQQRQVNEMRRAQHFAASETLMRQALAARHEWMTYFRPEWIPPERRADVEEILSELGSWNAFSCIRNYVDHLQAIYFARKADMLADDHWRSMHSLFRGFFAPQVDRALFERLIKLEMITDEFAQFGRKYIATGIWEDPLGRLSPAAN